MRTPLLLGILLVLALPGCRAPAGGGGGAAGAPLVPPPIGNAGQRVPAYGEVIRRYNAAAPAGLSRFSASVGVELAYAEPGGATREESGAGKLLYRRPSDTALSVGVLGNTILWAGSNANRWWVFSDLHREGRLTDGPLAGGPSGVAGLPFRPDAVPLVLGLQPLDPDAVPPEPAVERVNGFWLVEPPGVGARLLIDPRTARAVRVDLLGPGGRSRVAVRLDGEAPVAGAEPGTTLPRLIDAYPLDGGTRLTLTVRSAGADDPALRDRLFDLDFLIGYHRPATRDGEP
ncbi:hypothetical protein [Phycisphaera mikurensis]|uniref:Uncharacterized protein n=1 Tax=Phycisphaera mikurensis (strain NBRC 102666 / KCTC 22515 / FYK2301M01) TaxID=1142394 RepID=I0IH54_PHYMF|nr:hypothetical protein [Phycisphaera mikurensis]MBB6440844.1 hypothetical protein [Phycisphaera mikurensis]BAM04592.1 hypothetical protein PSMK_24330 [Phycisphaera mikurensis NBRC 102666]